MQEATTFNNFYDGISFQHLATLLLSVSTLCYGPGLLFGGPLCIITIYGYVWCKFPFFPFYAWCQTLTYGSIGHLMVPMALAIRDNLTKVTKRKGSFTLKLNVIANDILIIYLMFSALRTVIQLLTYLLTAWSRVLLEKLASLQLVKIYGTRRFLTAFTSARQLSLS